MDLALYMRVAWRFKFLLLLGFFVALALAFLSLFKIAPGGHPPVKYRAQMEWRANQTLMVTQLGFPWGSSAGVSRSNPYTYSQLATIYTNLVTSDAVRQIVRRHFALDPVYDRIDASPVLTQPWNPNSAPLPLVQIFGTSTTSARAKALASAAGTAFREYIGRQQAANQIPDQQRVAVTLVRSFDPPELMKGHSKTLPIVVFMTVMMAFLGLSLVLENLRPRSAGLAEEAPPAAPTQVVRRTA